MTDNWACSKIISHLGKRCTCGGCFNINYKLFELKQKSFVEDYMAFAGWIGGNTGVKGPKHIMYVGYLKQGINFKCSKTMLRHIPRPIYISRRLCLNREFLQILGPSNAFNNKMIFISCPKCQKKVLLQYKLSPILGK